MKSLCARPLLQLALAAGLLASAQAAHAQTWTRVTRNAPSGVNLMILMSDGTVMCANNNGTSTIGRAWYRLTPDSHGSYINGTWTTLASMLDTRLYYSSQLLRDGRLLVAGGEYGTGGARAEIYDPIANTWTASPIPTSVLNPSAISPATGGNQIIYDANSEILPNGNVLISPVGPRVAGGTIVFNPTTNAWSSGPRLFRGVYQDEASWVKLRDGTILTIDPFGTNSERYNPVTNTWINDSTVPVSLYDPFAFELGAGFILADGRAIILGSTGHTALYTPSGTTAPGVWAAGPDFPNGQGTPDAPGAMLVTGNILCAASATPTAGNLFPSPTRFYEYNPTTNAFTSVPGPTGTTLPISTYMAAMLDLPDGSVLLSRFSSTVYCYRPAGEPMASAKPTITSITPNGNGSYHLVGTQLNGISEGASYGDDFQMNSNYPLVRLTNAQNFVFYARTFNWSSTGVQTGDTPVSTEFTLPANLPEGQYSLVVVTNGIASDPTTFCTTPLSIASQPAPLTACHGGEASFTISATGTAALAYQWRRDGGPLADGPGIAGATSETLVLSGVEPALAGAYDCVVSNGCGSVTSNPAVLAVQDCCPADFNGDGFMDFFDYDDFVNCFETGACPPGRTADFNGDDFADFFDYDAFVTAFEAGC